MTSRLCVRLFSIPVPAEQNLCEAPPKFPAGSFRMLKSMRESRTGELRPKLLFVVVRTPLITVETLVFSLVDRVVRTDGLMERFLCLTRVSIGRSGTLTTEKSLVELLPLRVLVSVGMRVWVVVVLVVVWAGVLLLVFARLLRVVVGLGRG